ncbi:hypothetical protein GH733_014547 [Mirounga leonina]|nr:hypothetical protein GH733_014547 [Mirounga leonina]
MRMRITVRDQKEVNLKEKQMMGEKRKGLVSHGDQEKPWTDEETGALEPLDMLLLGPRVLLFLTALILPSDLVNEPSTDETVLADIEPSTDDLASPTDKNTTTDCRDEKFACTRLYSVHRPVKQCIHQLCFTSLRRMYIINNEICSRLVCKEHEVMKDELCRQMAGLPPRRLRRSNYFRLPPCENVNLQRPSGL